MVFMGVILFLFPLAASHPPLFFLGSGGMELYVVMLDTFLSFFSLTIVGWVWRLKAIGLYLCLTSKYLLFWNIHCVGGPMRVRVEK